MKNLIDAHTHSLASGHAYSTIKENFEAAVEMGLTYYGLSDHGPKMLGGPHEYFFSNLRVVPSTYKSVHVLKGAELNILDQNGSVDLSKRDLASLDYTIASIHHPCFEISDKEGNTNAIINAMKNQYVKIIGHPDDARVPLDYEKIVLAAKKYHTLLEVNNSSLLPTSFREGARDNYKEMIQLCIKHEVPVICDSDAHIESAIGKVNYAFELLEEMNFPAELITNYSEELIKEYILDPKPIINE